MHATVAKAHHTLSRGAMTLYSFFAVIFVTAGSAAPTPLYRLYQQSMDLTPLLITVVFAIYSFSLLATLLTVGGLSDYLGRRPVILAALLLNIVALVLFATAESIGQLIVARAIQGIAVGSAMTAMGAAILDTDRARGALLNSVTIFLGLTFGALGSGVLVTYAPHPLHLVYTLLLVATAVFAVMLWAMPETISGKAGALASLKPHMSVPSQSKRVLLRLTPANVAVWALGAFYLSLMPNVVATTMQIASPLIGGIVVATLMGTAAITVPALKEWLPRRLVLTGTSALSLGVAVSLLGIAQHQVGALLAGTVIAGFGLGANFSGTLRSLLPTAKPDQRAGLLAAFYVECYLAFSLPAIVAGLAVPYAGLTMTAYVYGVAVIVLVAISLIASLWSDE